MNTYIYDPQTFCSPQKLIDIRSAISFLDVTYGADFEFPGEQHNFWEIVYIVEGTARISADDRLYTLSGGEAIFHKPMEWHKICSAHSKLHICVFTFEAFGSGMMPLEKCALQLTEAMQQLVHRMIREAERAFERDGCMIQSVKDVKSCQIYFNLLEVFLLSVGNEREPFHTKDPDSLLFSEIIHLLKSYTCQRISIDFIAKECHISSSGLKKKFRKYTGMGVLEYHTRLQIEEAMHLLSEGLSIKEVSNRLSFSSQFYFSSVFKRITGITPSTYKRSRLRE